MVAALRIARAGSETWFWEMRATLSAGSCEPLINDSSNTSSTGPGDVAYVLPDTVSLVRCPRASSVAILITIAAVDRRVAENGTVAATTRTETEIVLGSLLSNVLPSTVSSRLFRHDYKSRMKRFI